MDVINIKTINRFRPVFLWLIVVFATACNERISSEDGFQTVDLPDNSVIYMNKGSEITFPKDFLENRVVTLEGEAYFDIEKSDHPFVIKTDVAEIVVLGTELNVKTGESKEEFEVEVDKGKVEVTADSERIVIDGGEKVSWQSDSFKKGKASKAFRRWLGQLERELEQAGRKIEKDLQRGEKMLERGVHKTEKKLRQILD